MRFPTRIDRYLAKLIFVPLLGTLCLAAMLLLLDRMLRLFDFVVSEGGPVSVVWRMLANLIPEYLGLAIPVGLTLGVLLAFRKLALSSELDTLRAVGLGYGRLLRVPYLYALVLLVAQFRHRRLRPALRPICLSEPALRAALGRARRLDQGRRVHQSRPADDAARRAQRESAAPTCTASSCGSPRRDGRSLAVDRRPRHLPRHRRSRHHPVPPHQRPAWSTTRRAIATPRVLSFVQHDLPIDLPTIEAFRGRGDGTKELTIPELVRIGGDARAPAGAAQRGPRQFPLPAWSRWR